MLFLFLPVLFLAKYSLELDNVGDIVFLSLKLMILFKIGLKFNKTSMLMTKKMADKTGEKFTK